MPKDVAAPAAYANSSIQVRNVGPWIAAPVRIKPRIGPAHGAQSRPVAAPSTTDPTAPDRDRAQEFKRFPNATKGRVNLSVKTGTISIMPSTPKSASDTNRPYSFARTSHGPPADTATATSANVAAMPTRRGKPAFRNGWSARANTNGITGRIQGLRIVSTPPKYASTKSTIVTLSRDHLGNRAVWLLPNVSLSDPGTFAAVSFDHGRGRCPRRFRVSPFFSSLMANDSSRRYASSSFTKSSQLNLPCSQSLTAKKFFHGSFWPFSVLLSGRPVTRLPGGSRAVSFSRRKTPTHDHR